MAVVFVPTDECLVDEPSAARRGIVAREIPVAWVVGTRLVQSIDALEHQFDGGLHVLWAQHLDNLLIDFLNGERLVDAPDVISLQRTILACAINLLDKFPPAKVPIPLALWRGGGGEA